MIDAIWEAKHGQQQPIQAPVAPLAKSGETRQQKWRRLHPERYRESQRKLMARLRKKQAK